jgi:hypothetical protein
MAMDFIRGESRAQRYQYIVLLSSWPVRESSISTLFHIIPRMVKKPIAASRRLISTSSVTAELPQSAGVGNCFAIYDLGLRRGLQVASGGAIFRRTK